MTILFIVAFLLLALIGTPLFALIGGLALILLMLSGVDIAVAAVEMYRITSSPTLIAVPLFTVAGYVLAESKTPQRLVRLSRTLLGWLPGGLAIVSLVVCALFTAFTGATGVTIIAVGGLLLPALLKEGYPRRFSLGLVTTSGSLGLLFPPSLAVIIYGFVAGSSLCSWRRWVYAADCARSCPSDAFRRWRSVGPCARRRGSFPCYRSSWAGFMAVY
jgi:C4-dicarboxylate transporter DctM subunit